MSEEYLLAWNDHHSTFFSAMSELVSGDMNTVHDYIIICLQLVQKMYKTLHMPSIFIIWNNMPGICLQISNLKDLKLSNYCSGDLLTDVSIWAGQTLFSAHKLVLALSSSYFRLVLTGPGLSDSRLIPVIFLKDVSARDFERLLSYMYKGEVSYTNTCLQHAKD